MDFFQLSQSLGSLKYFKKHRISLSVWHMKPGGVPILTPDLISESWTLPFLHCKLLCMALRKCLIGLVRTTNSEVWRLQDVKGRVLTPWRSLKHCLLQFKASLAVPNPLRGQLVPGVTWIRQRKLELIKGLKTNWMALLKRNNPEGCLI